MKFTTLKYGTGLGLGLLLLSGCASYEISTDYLGARARPALQVPGDLQGPRSDNGGASVPNLSDAERQGLQPQSLFLPPQVIDKQAAKGDGQAPGKQGPAVAQLHTDANGASYLQISLRFDQAWSRVRLALMSSGFTLTDMNRSDGQFYIRYRDPDAGKGDRDEFVLHLLEIGSGSRLLVRSTEGAILSDAASLHILKLIRENL